MVIGTCGNCGGPVETPDIWYGTCAPVPTCRRCHSVPVNAYGPKIPMRQRAIDTNRTSCADDWLAWYRAVGHHC